VRLFDVTPVDGATAVDVLLISLRVRCSDDYPTHTRTYTCSKQSRLAPEPVASIEFLEILKRNVSTRAKDILRPDSFLRYRR